MKLKFTSKAADQAPEPVSRKPSSSGGLKLNLKLNTVGDAGTIPAGQLPLASSPQTLKVDEPKPKRKYTKKPKIHEDGEGVALGKGEKKRKLKDDPDGKVGRGPVKRPNLGTKTSSITLRIPPSDPTAGDGPTVLSLKGANRPKITIPARHVSKQRTASTPHIRIKSKGMPPPRPVAQGYDSEAEDIEDDPAIESQLILRMQPGEDCDYLHRAIQEKRIGLKPSEGGADVSMRFLTDRRAVVTIRGRHYAACLLDLPCIVEAMKSWDRRGWYKSADVCQILVVLGRISNEDEARSAPLPQEIDPKNHQYPHGLTPPMHLVRKRRFRKRVSNSAILEVESEVRRLLQADEEARNQGGKTEYSLVDIDELDSKELVDEGLPGEAGTPRDQYGAVVPGYEQYEDAEGDEEDEDEMLALMAQGFAQSHEGTATVIEAEASGAGPNAHVSPGTLLPIGADPEAGISPAPTDRTGGTGELGNAERDNMSSGDEDDAEEFDDDDDDDDDDEVDIDEVELARQQELTQLKEEVEDLRREIADAEKAMQKQANPLLRQRAAGKVRSLKEDLRLKLASLGQDEVE